MEEKAVISILRTPKGAEARYCTVTSRGDLIGCYARLSDIRKRYRHSIEMGNVVLIRELDRVYVPKKI